MHRDTLDHHQLFLETHSSIMKFQNSYLGLHISLMRRQTYISRFIVNQRYTPNVVDNKPDVWSLSIGPGYLLNIILCNLGDDETILI